MVGYDTSYAAEVRPTPPERRERSVYWSLLHFSAAPAYWDIVVDLATHHQSLCTGEKKLVRYQQNLSDEHHYIHDCTCTGTKNPASRVKVIVLGDQDELVGPPQHRMCRTRP